MSDSKSPLIQRAIRLVEYLEKLAHLGTTLIRKVDQYEYVLWLDSIPHEPSCYSIHWDDTGDQASEHWIEVEQPAEPRPPDVPDLCKAWVDQHTLHDVNTGARLLEKIIEPETDKEVIDEDGEASATRLKELLLSDFPDVSLKWEAYKSGPWTEWAEKFRRWQAIHGIYSRLFEMHKAQQRLGEEYELVIGQGLLNWVTPTGQPTRRHLVVGRCELEFEPSKSRFTVSPNEAGVGLDFELDMLDPVSQPQRFESAAREKLKKAEDDLWDREVIDDVLQTAASSLTDRGEYYPGEMRPPETLSEKPCVSFTPALILRKRTQRGLLKVLHDMKEQIGNSEILPPEFDRLCEGDRRHERHPDLGEIDGQFTEIPSLHFPLPTNEEQQRIVHVLTSQDSVLVQGPPGTGKSHTIANLICHFLATGQKILVTAQTPRALEVLHRKLPNELKPLCVSLLGTGTKERNALEQSVRGILERFNEWSRDFNRKESARLKQDVLRLKEEAASISAKILALRERETRGHSFVGGKYVGTPGRIAERLSAERTKFCWFEDRLQGSCPEGAAAQAKNFVTLLRTYPKKLIDELDLKLPPWDYLPDIERLHTAIDRERELHGELNESTALLDTPHTRMLQKLSQDGLEQLELKLGVLLRRIGELRAKRISWIDNAIEDILSDRTGTWRELFDRSVDALQKRRLLERARLADETRVTTSGRDEREIESDAVRLRDHLNNGGSLGWGPFRPRVVREVKYLLSDVRIDGTRCNSVESLEALITHLGTIRDIEAFCRLWEDHIPQSAKPCSIRIKQLHDGAMQLRDCLELKKAHKELTDCLAGINGIDGEQLTDIAFHTDLFRACSRLLKQREFENLNKQIQTWSARVTNSKGAPIHPVAERIKHSILERNVVAYADARDQLSTLQAKADELRVLRELKTQLSAKIPTLVKRIEENPDDPTWDERLGQFESAWNWSATSKWLQEFNAQNEDSLKRQLTQLEEDIEEKESALAGSLAWGHCFDPNRLNADHLSHLKAWQQAMKRGGKFTGKHAARHLRDAQYSLDRCKNAIPAWIMPLYRVYEMVAVRPETFDIIIVDEASQCGPDALPLLYLGKKVIVVGDDRQISPEGSFIDGDAVQALMQQFLFDFDHRASFGPSTSFFDHTDIRVGHRISLREHFRCMPEIIRFSNDLCYQASPLIPLRQYPPDRLPPLERCYVEGGFREGSGQAVINRPEANAIVEQIMECCVDSRYQRKNANGVVKKLTMGVIVLQGKAQARLIEQSLFELLGAEEIEERRIVCGESYSFQGDERDVMFLSLVAAPNVKIGPLVKGADERRFNVAASRARDQMWLFHSATVDDLSPSCYRRQLLEYFMYPTSAANSALNDIDGLRESALRAKRTIEKPPRPFDSWFEVDVALQIANKGFRVVPQFPIGGRRIDLMIEGARSSLAVECHGDAWHGPERFMEDAFRQRTLERQGWQFWVVRDSTYYANPEAAMESLWEELRTFGIEPIGRC
jgi:very-short-patch-repair endonuclease